MNFKFQNYAFDTKTYTAEFCYRGADGTDFKEVINFAKPLSPITPDQEILENALFLSFILIGTSYYKAHPTPEIDLDTPLAKNQAEFFTTVYQDGLSQYAYENHLSRKDLAHFRSSVENSTSSKSYDGKGILALQSGGKDSLLTASLLKKSAQNYSFWYLGSSEKHPEVLNSLPSALQTATRKIDLENLKKSGGKNGHVPVTYIVQSLALIQAILNGQNTVYTSIGHEGAEPATVITGEDGEPDLPVNHQWSKTWEAELLFSDYVHTYISTDLTIGSPLRKYSELKIAELFAENCWNEFGHKFSSCNVANYHQKNDNSELKWCGKCSKCANSYLLFAPFVSQPELDSLFENNSLFQEPSLEQDFKGLLGLDGVLKPFECVGETDELRKAYHLRQSPAENFLPFDVPDSSFDKDFLYPSQNIMPI